MSKTQKFLKWKAKTSFQKGLKKTIKSYQRDVQKFTFN